MKPVKRSFTIAGHRTSISLEEPFWQALKEMAALESCPVATLVERIDAQRGRAGLSSAVRVWVLDRYRRGCRPPAPPSAGHVPDRSPRPY